MSQLKSDWQSPCGTLPRVSFGPSYTFAQLLHRIHSLQHFTCESSRSTRASSGVFAAHPSSQSSFSAAWDRYLGSFQAKQEWESILVMTDYHSKGVEAAASPMAIAGVAVKDFVESVVLCHRAPETLITDRGKQFIASPKKEMLRLFGANHRQNSIPPTKRRTMRAINSHFGQHDWYVRIV